MSGRESHPIYAEGVAYYLGNDIRGVNRVLKRTGLSAFEKALLRTRLHLKVNELDLALAMLSKTGQAPSLFLQSERALLKATTLSRKGAHGEAARSNIEAYNSFRALEDRRGTFLSSYNLAADLGRLGKIKEADQYLAGAMQASSTPGERALCLRGLAAQASKKLHFDRALEHLNELEGVLADPLDRNLVHLVAADILARKGDLDQAYARVNSFKPTQKDPELPRMLFEKQVLEFLRECAPWPGRLPARMRTSREYALKWRILSALMGGEEHLARSLWIELQVLSPETYGEAFEARNASDRLSSFFRAIARISTPATSKALPASQASSLAEQLVLAIRRAPFPMRKEALIESVWKVPYDPSLDARFYKLIERIRKDGSAKIEIRNRTYLVT